MRQIVTKLTTTQEQAILDHLNELRKLETCRAIIPSPSYRACQRDILRRLVKRIFATQETTSQ